MSTIETDQQRVAIFEILVERLGLEQAKYLMSNHPPGGWEQFATKDDLKVFATKDDLKAVDESTKQEFKALEESTKRELKALEESTKRELKALEESTKRELERFATKDDLKAVEKSIRGEMKEGFAAVQVSLAGVLERSAKTAERRAGIYYANVLTLLVLAVAIVSFVLNLD